MANKTITNTLASKLKAKQDERTAEFRNPYIDGKDFVAFADFRKQLDDKVMLSCLTKLKKHVKDEAGNFAKDENGEFLWEELYAFIDSRYPDTWSWGGSALKAIYHDLVDEELTEEELNKMLKENPLSFKLRNKKLENGKNKGHIMVEWINN